MDELNRKLDQILKSNTETNERIDLVNVKLNEIAEIKARQAGHEDRITYLEMDGKLLRRETEKLKESISSEDETDEENDAMIVRENLRRKELKKKKVLVQSPDFQKKISFKDALGKDLKDMQVHLLRG